VSKDIKSEVQQKLTEAGITDAEVITAHVDQETGEVLTDDQHNEQLAELFMLGDLVKVATRLFKDQQVAFRLMTEAEQSNMLKKVAEDIKPAVKKAVQIIKSHGRIEFRAEVTKVIFKGASDVEGTLKLSNYDGAHALADYAGGFVTIVIDKQDDMMNPGDSTVGMPDQPDLLDDHEGESE
jgi:predicted house-cleaning NTP pyrophosphatase (Maf/HAM1 superfamily)